MPSWKDPLRSFYSSLPQLLRAKVEGNRLACPTYYFHSQESEQNARVKDYVWQLMEHLSHSLSVNSFILIHSSQIASAAYVYAGKEALVVPDWAIALDQDPHEPVESATSGDEFTAHQESPQEIIDYTR